MFLLSIQLFRSNLNENGSNPAQRVSALDPFPERCFTILALQDTCVILAEAVLEVFSSNVTALRNAAHELNIIILLSFMSGKNISLKKPQTNIKSTAVSPKTAGVYKLKISSLDTTLMCQVSVHFDKSLKMVGQSRK